MHDTGFRPSRDGWPFSNGSVVGTPLRLGPVPVGQVIGGLCGGMCLSAGRRWREHRPIPTDRSAALQEIFAAQLRSFDVLHAPYRYLRLQRPGADVLRIRTTREALRDVGSSLRSGEPTPIALVCALSNSPLALTRHHVCLAYRVTGTSDTAEIAVYDPNYPGRDDVTLQLDGGAVRHSRGRTVHAVFPLAVR